MRNLLLSLGFFLWIGLFALGAESLPGEVRNVWGDLESTVFSDAECSEVLFHLSEGEPVFLQEAVPFGIYRIKTADGREGYMDARTVYAEQVPDFDTQVSEGYSLLYSVNDEWLEIRLDGETVLESSGSSGLPATFTPRGIYRIEPDRRGTSWFSTVSQVEIRYWVGFRGVWLFHSLPYKREGELIEEEAEKLGRPASRGCIRLPEEIAAYIYHHIPENTPVFIF